MTAIILAFFAGFLVAFIHMLYVLGKRKQAWQAEYRRLMGGIKRLYEGIEMHEGKESCATDTATWSPLCAAYRLRQLFNDEPTWPRE